MNDDSQEEAPVLDEARRRFGRAVIVVLVWAAVMMGLGIWNGWKAREIAQDVSDQQVTIADQQQRVRRQQRLLSAQQRVIADLVAGQQQSRFEASLRACRIRNRQNLGIRQISARAVPALIGEVRVKFPLEPSCVKYARRAVAIR